MKLIIILTLVTFIFTIASAQWTELSPVGQNTTLTSVSFLSDETGLICGANQIWKTLDGGQSWAAVFTGVPALFLEEILWINDNQALSIGFNFDNNQGVILRSVNGGVSWNPVSSPVSSALKDVFFVNESTGYICGQGTVLRTSNGGQSWSNVSNGSAGGQAIFFVNENIGFVAGGSPVSASLERTTNGGASWTPIAINSGSFLQAINFPSANVGYTVGWNGEILKSEDGGLTWNQLTGVYMNGNLDVFFLDNDWGYIAGGSQMMASIQKTGNGGALWEEEAPSVPHGLVSIDFTTNKTGYAVGSSGTVLKNSTVTTTNLRLPVADEIKVYPNPSTGQIWAEAPGQLITGVKVFDDSGRLVSEGSFSSPKAGLDFSGLPSANYYLMIESAQTSVVRKIVKVAK